MDPPLEDPAELIEHMELFLDPRLEGEEGGVWNTTPPSVVLISFSTYMWILEAVLSKEAVVFID